MKLNVQSVAWHRNGVGGVGFYAVLFRDQEKERDMVASLFDEPGYCAVYDVGLLAKGSVKFAENSWRGDVYEAALRPLLKAYLSDNGTNRIGPFSLPTIS